MVSPSFILGFGAMKSSKMNFIESPGNKVRKKDISGRIKVIIKVMDKITHSM